jgi:Spy/CpxP family protein refolding chaperone
MALSTRKRSINLTSIALILSLALNVCAVGGFLYSSWNEMPHGTGMEYRLDMLSKRLHLTAAQMPVFEEFRQSLRHNQEALGQYNDPLLAQAWTELIKPEPDLTTVQGFIDQMSMHRHAFQIDVSASLVHLLAALTPEQRVQLAKIVTDRKDPGGGPIRINVGN